MLAQVKKPRDNRIDLLRGFAMIVIGINHYGWLVQGLGFAGWTVPTFTHFGYSSAAEIFVFLSGYMVGQVYLDKPDFRYRLLSRVKDLYLINLLMFIVCGLIAYLANSALSSETSFNFFIERPVFGTFSFVALLYQPLYLDVLTLYIVLMLACVVFAKQIVLWPKATLLVSAAVYAAVQIGRIKGYSINVPGGPPQDDWMWDFNPFAWQLIFMTAVVTGRQRLLTRSLEYLESHRLHMIVSAVIMMLALSVYYIDVHTAFNMPFVIKRDLGAIRIMHSLASLYFFCCIVVLLKPLYQGLFCRVVALIGQNTLHCYAASIPATYLLAELCRRFGNSQLAYLISLAALLLFIYGVAYWRQRSRLNKRSNGLEKERLAQV